MSLAPFRRRNLPLLLLAVVAVLAASCSSSSSEGPNTGSSDSSGSGDDESSVVNAGAGANCGPAALTIEAVQAAGGRIDDATVLAFEAVGLPLVAPELWSVVTADDEMVAIVDPEPLDASDNYWVRVAQPGSGSFFDGVCSFGESGGTGSPEAPATCSVVVDGGSITVVWTGADPGASVAVVRDGTDLHVVAPSALPADLQTAFDARRNQHGELVLEAGGGTTLEAGSGGFSDVAAEPGVTYSYEVQAVGGSGTRSSGVACGDGEVTAESLDITCSTSVDEFGWPIIRWEGAGSARIGLLRDGVTLEPDAVVFSSPHIDRDAPPGAESSYSLTVPGGTDVVCGTVTVGAGSGGSTELQQAATENVIDHKGPFEYVTLEPICASCDGTMVEIYLVPDPDGGDRHKVQTVWIDGVETSADGVWLIDPLFAAPTLLDAEAEGISIDYSIDPDTGLIERWTIGGEGADLVCFEIDTRPIDMRDRCGAQNMLG